MEIVFDINEINIVAKQFIELINGYKIITLTGEMGAGKTTLVSAIFKELGVEEIVTSPTYAIIQAYNTADNKIIYHLDLYRIKSNQEAIEAGVEDCIESGELCFVEWPEKAMLLFSENIVKATLEYISNNKRKLIVQLPQ